MKRLATLALLSFTACGEPPQPAPVAAPSAAGEAKAAADGEAAAQVEPAAKVEMQELAPGVEIPKKLANGIPLLTPMDFALCMIPAAELTTVEERRQRGYARRKLVMNNPDSPTARVLADLTEAAKNGEIAPPSFEQADASSKDSGVVFSLPGTTPQGGRPPAGYRPPAGSQSETQSETKSETKSEEPPAQ